MTIKTAIQHVALEFNNKKNADIFFIKVLGLNLDKSFNLSEKLSYDIFGIKQKMEINVYSNEKSCFEIFFSKKPKIKLFEHICIEVDDKEEFIKRCKEHKIKPFNIKKGEKNLLFIKDQSNNLYEIKAKKIK